MKLLVDAEQLHAALSQSVAPRTTPMDALKHAIFETQGESLVITTTDDRVMLSQSLEASITTPGRCTAEATQVRTVLTGLTGDVALEFEPMTGKDGDGSATLAAIGQLHIFQNQATGRGRLYKLDSINPDAIPIPSIGNIELIELEPDTLATAIARVGYAVATDDARIFLNGLTLHGDWIGGADGHRAAVYYPEGANLPHIIIPHASLKPLSKALSAGGSLGLIHSESHPVALVVQNEHQVFYTRLVDHKPFDITNAFRAADGAMADFSVKSLQGVLARISGSINKPIRLERCEDDAVRVSSCDESMEEVVECTLSGEFTVGLTPRYLQDVLAVADDSVRWMNPGVGDPQVFTIGDRPEKHVIMPCRI